MISPVTIRNLEYLASKLHSDARMLSRLARHLTARVESAKMAGDGQEFEGYGCDEAGDLDSDGAHSTYQIPLKYYEGDSR